MRFVKYTGFLTLLVITLSGQSQSNFQAKLNLLNAFLPLTETNYAWKPEKSFDFQPGIQLSYEFFLYDKKLSNRITGHYVYSNPVSSVFVSTSLHWAVYNKWKSAVNIFGGIGTGFSFNESENGVASTPFPVFGLEYNRSITEKADLSASISHPYPFSINLQIGLRYWISKKIKQKAGCLSCPN